MGNIRDLLNKIRYATYGKEVRQSIHDAIEECYATASVDHDNANMEVKIARGTHNTLNDRLVENEKKQENLSSQLDNNTNEINKIASEKANKTDLTSPFNFKGSCLSTELPTRANVNDTWYCTDLKYRKTWNGTSWEQSSLNETEYSDELNVINEKLNTRLYHIKSKNLLDVSKAIDGYRENYDATVVEASGYSYVRMPVKPNTTYTVSELNIGNIFIFQLDSNIKGIKPPVSVGYPNKSITFTTTEKTAFISVNFETKNKNSVQLEESDSQSSYTPYENFYRTQDYYYLSDKKYFD